MKTRQLQAFHATVLTGTLSEAAKSLQISQPTVSRLLTDLEASVGLRLFERRRGNVSPTAEGMLFYQRLEDVYESFDFLSRAAEDIRRDRSKELKIISSPALSASIVTDVIAEYTKQNPGISISLVTIDITTLFSKLENLGSDIAFTNKLGNQPHIEQEILVEVDFVCALPKNHKLTAKSEITPADIIGENFIHLTNENVINFHEHDQLFSNFNIPIEKNLSTQHSSNAYSMVAQGLGIAILEPFSAKLWKGMGVVTRPFKPSLKYTYTACFNAQVQRSNIARDFLELARPMFKKFENKLS